MVTAPPQHPAPSTGARKPWWRRTWTLPFALITLVFLSTAVPPYLSLDPAAAPIPIRPEPAWYYPLLVTHIFGGTLLMLIAVAQLWPWLRRTRPALHRWSGRVYLLAGLPMVGLASLLIGPLAHGSTAVAFNNVVWALAWSAFTLLGFAAARRKDFARHREWMLRGVVLLYAVALARITLPLMVMAFLWLGGAPAGGVDALVEELAPLSLLVNVVFPLLALEWWFQYGRGSRSSRTRSPH